MKILIFLTSIIVVLFLMLNLPLMADDCPDGYDGPYTIQSTFYYSIPGVGDFTCSVYIVYCCMFDHTTTPKRVINEIEETYETTGNHCIANIPQNLQDDFERWKHEVVAKNSECIPLIPPCDEDSLVIVKTNSAICKYYKNYEKFTETEFILSLKSDKCTGSTAKCESEWRLCMDYSVNPPATRWTYVGTTLIGAPGCGSQTPSLPPSGKTWDEYWETECFIWGCE
jgi:hypothetical protein